MKNKTFIIWNGKSARRMAAEVKRLLNEDCIEAVVGGETGGESGLYVGQSVLMEMNSCDRALCIIKKPEDGKPISENVYFELGYAIARYGAGRIYIYLVDVSRKDLPSDLAGIWADDIIEDIEELGTSDTGDKTASADHATNDTGDKTASADHATNSYEKNIAKEISKKYVKKYDASNVCNKENRMNIIRSYYKWRTYLKEYIDGTDKSMLDRYSDDELALYMLMFSRAAYLYEDVDMASVILKEYFDIINYNSDAQTSLLTIAVRFGLEYLKMIKARTHGNEVYLDYSNYMCYHRMLKKIREEYEELKKKNKKGKNDQIIQTFDDWFTLKLESTLSYANILHAMSPQMANYPEERNKALDNSVAHSRKSIEKSEKMKDHFDKELVLLYKIYDSRNIFRANSMKTPPEKSYQDLTTAYESAKDLYYGYCSGDQSDQLMITLEMEYRLICSEIVAEQKGIGENETDGTLSNYEIQEITTACNHFLKKTKEKKNHTKQQWYYNRIDSIKQNLETDIGDK